MKQPIVSDCHFCFKRAILGGEWYSGDCGQMKNKLVGEDLSGKVAGIEFTKSCSLSHVGGS